MRLEEQSFEILPLSSLTRSPAIDGIRALHANREWQRRGVNFHTQPLPLYHIQEGECSEDLDVIVMIAACFSGDDTTVQSLTVTGSPVVILSEGGIGTEEFARGAAALLRFTTSLPPADWPNHIEQLDKVASESSSGKLRVRRMDAAWTGLE